MDLQPGTEATVATEAGEPSSRDVVVWRYADMCHHWGVSRATVERWVQRYETSGVGIPVHRDPSGRPYWLAHEASAAAARSTPAAEPVASANDDRLERLRRAARRRHRIA